MNLKSPAFLHLERHGQALEVLRGVKRFEIKALVNFSEGKHDIEGNFIKKTEISLRSFSPLLENDRIIFTKKDEIIEVLVDKGSFYEGSLFTTFLTHKGENYEPEKRI